MGKEKIDQFDPFNDPNKTGLLWKAWKRNFMLYLDSKEVMTDGRRLAKLLFLAGPEVQRMYEQEKAARENDESDGEVVSEYQEALDILDGIFLKQKNEPFQRSFFRQINQKSGESFVAFVGRLREQAQFCNFGSSEAVDKALKDQIIEGGSSEKLRRELLKKERSIQDIIQLAQSFENVEQYEKATKRKANDEDVHEVQTKKPADRRDYAGPSQRPSDRRCWACGRSGHIRGDAKCPAKGKKCLKCNRFGHFSVCCKAPKQTRRPTYGVRAMEDMEPDDDPTEYVFQVGGASKKIDCKVGGVSIKVVIDSGTRRNLIPVSVWESMKKQKVNVKQMLKGSDVTFKAYGQNDLIPVRGRFEAELELNGKKSLQWFYVVEKGDSCLLGEDTSTEHGVLRVGVSAKVEEKVFPKMKGNNFGRDW